MEVGIDHPPLNCSIHLITITKIQLTELNYTDINCQRYGVPVIPPSRGAIKPLYFICIATSITTLTYIHLATNYSYLHLTYLQRDAIDIFISSNHHHHCAFFHSFIRGRINFQIIIITHCQHINAKPIS